MQDLTRESNGGTFSRLEFAPTQTSITSQSSRLLVLWSSGSVCLLNGIHLPLQSALLKQELCVGVYTAPGAAPFGHWQWCVGS